MSPQCLEPRYISLLFVTAQTTALVTEYNHDFMAGF